MEWHINDEIAYLHRVISGMGNGGICNPVTDRLFQLSIISLFHQINDSLDKLSSELDTSVILEGVSIDFDTYLDENYWTNNLLFKNEEGFYNQIFNIKVEDITCRFQINQMTDYLPNGEEGYNITQDQIDTFKTSLNLLCDRKKLGSREILYALLFGLHYMLHQLKKIKEKVEHPKSHQYIKVWEEVYDDYEDISCRDSYIEWKEENDEFNFVELKRQQIFEIFRMLNSGFFRFYDSITGADVRNRKLIITEDDLPVGKTISENLPAECAKLEKFIEWKGEHVIALNYEKLGKYIYKNYNNFEIDDIDVIVEFDKTMDAIHEDMASLKPQLKQYLKGYEEEQVNVLLNECSDILNTCKIHLAKDINDSFLYIYLKRLLFNKEMKDEARKKLSGQSRNTFICEIVAVLKNAKIFKVECDKHDLARSLSEKITRIQLDTIVKNIERAYNSNEGTLYHWTMKNIEELKKESSNPFAGII